MVNWSHRHRPAVPCYVSDLCTNNVYEWRWQPWFHGMRWILLMWDGKQIGRHHHITNHNHPSLILNHIKNVLRNQKNYGWKSKNFWLFCADRLLCQQFVKNNNFLVNRERQKSEIAILTAMLGPVYAINLIAMHTKIDMFCCPPKSKSVIMSSLIVVLLTIVLIIDWHLSNCQVASSVQERKPRFRQAQHYHYCELVTVRLYILFGNLFFIFGNLAEGRISLVTKLHLP